jgi:hypothetical protein
MSDHPPQQQVPPELPIGVTLTALQWRAVLQMLSEGHHQLRVVGPIYGEIERQCNHAIGTHMRGNGALHEEHHA